MKSAIRDVNGIKVIDLQGKITIGSGDVQLRDMIATIPGSTNSPRP